MAGNRHPLRAVVETFDEPALLIEAPYVRIANEPAKLLLGEGIEGRDLRLAIRHPQVLEHIVSGTSGELDVSGIGELGRSWRLILRRVDGDAVLVRMIDRSAAVSAEKMRVDFVANASHELRTPLSTILGYAETLSEQGQLSAQLRTKFASTIGDEARRMMRIVEDLMSLSRIEADRFVTPAERVDVSAIVTSAISNATPLMASRNCELRVQLPDSLPTVRGDGGQLVQVLDNLISNALRYGCDRPRSRIDVRAKSSGAWVLISVTDHGQGIPREHLPRVTERFYRVDAARSRESGGTGLGLAIVKHIIERHRGSLDIQSTVAVGTSVTVGLPAAP